MTNQNYNLVLPKIKISQAKYQTNNILYLRQNK